MYKKIIILFLIITIALTQSSNAVIMFESNSNDSKNFRIKNNAEILMNENICMLSTPSAELSYRPESYDFGDKYEGEIDNTILEIWNSGCCFLSYAIVEDCSWINVEPKGGGSTGEIDNITVEIDTTNMLIGNHSYNVSIITIDTYGIFKVNVRVISKPPDKPSKPTGPASGKAGNEYDYSTSTTDPDGDLIWYKWYWNDPINETSEWIGPFTSGQTMTTSHVWDEQGDYNIRVKAKDIHGEESPWSDPLTVTMPKVKLFNQIPRILIWLFERFPFLQPYFSQFK